MGRAIHFRTRPILKRVLQTSQFSRRSSEIHVVWFLPGDYHRGWVTSAQVVDVAVGVLAAIRGQPDDVGGPKVSARRVVFLRLMRGCGTGFSGRGTLFRGQQGAAAVTSMPPPSSTTGDCALTGRPHLRCLAIRSAMRCPCASSILRPGGDLNLAMQPRFGSWLRTRGPKSCPTAPRGHGDSTLPSWHGAGKNWRALACGPWMMMRTFSAQRSCARSRRRPFDGAKLARPVAATVRPAQPGGLVGSHSAGMATKLRGRLHGRGYRRNSRRTTDRLLIEESGTSASGQNFATFGRPIQPAAALLLGYIRQVCALVAPCVRAPRPPKHDRSSDGGTSRQASEVYGTTDGVLSLTPDARDRVPASVDGLLLCDRHDTVRDAALMFATTSQAAHAPRTAVRSVARVGQDRLAGHLMHTGPGHGVVGPDFRVVGSSAPPEC